MQSTVRPCLPAGFEHLADDCGDATVASGNFCRITKVHAVHPRTQQRRIIAAKWAVKDKPLVAEALRMEHHALTFCYQSDPVTSSRCLVRLEHPEVVNDEKTQGILLEFAPYGSLAAYRTATIMTERHAQYVARTLLKALELVHQCGFAHRDVKPHNVLVFPRGYGRQREMEEYLEGTGGCCGGGHGVAALPQPPTAATAVLLTSPSTTTHPVPFEIRLADFGLAKEICRDDNWARQCSGGDWSIMDPQLAEPMHDRVALTYEEYAKNDVYAVGLIVYFVLTGQSLSKQRREDWADDMFNPKPLAPAVSDEAWAFVKLLLSRREERPFAWTALTEDWLNADMNSRQASSATLAGMDTASHNQRPGSSSQQNTPVSSQSQMGAPQNTAAALPDVDAPSGQVVAHQITEVEFDVDQS